MPTAEELRAMLAEQEQVEATAAREAAQPQNIQEWIDSHEARITDLERRINGGAVS